MRTHLRRSWSRWPLFALVLLVGGCETALVPLEPGPYDYRLSLLSPGEGSELRTFHWPIGSTVRIYAVGDAAGRPSLREAVERGGAIWTDAALFDEVTVVRTDDLREAHAVVRWDDSEPVLTTPPNCTGPSSGAAATRICVNDEGTAFQTWAIRDGGASQVLFSVRVSPQTGMTDERAIALVTHEIGHVLGILAHSSDAEDLMWAGLIGENRELSLADRITFRTLYQTPVDIGY